jgi:hypothetical protein
MPSRRALRRPGPRLRSIPFTPSPGPCHDPDKKSGLSYTRLLIIYYKMVKYINIFWFFP